jgi:hypothetical protein
MEWRCRLVVRDGKDLARRRVARGRCGYTPGLCALRPPRAVLTRWPLFARSQLLACGSGRGVNGGPRREAEETSVGTSAT